MKHTFVMNAALINGLDSTCSYVQECPTGVEVCWRATVGIKPKIEKRKQSFCNVLLAVHPVLCLLKNNNNMLFNLLIMTTY